MQGRKILIIDDDPDICHLLATLFARSGAEVQTATSAWYGLQHISNQEPDLIILDIMMPIIDGFDVCNTVKNELGMDDVFIVMLTAKGQEVDKQRSAEVGADLYLTKPFDPDKVFSIARQVLGL